VSAGVPVHTFRKDDARFLKPMQPVFVRFSLLPTSIRFKRGQRVRLSIGGADAGHFGRLPPPPGVKKAATQYTLQAHTGPSYVSQLLLPSPDRGQGEEAPALFKSQ
jgi:predicted acyl esterase